MLANGIGVVDSDYRGEWEFRFVPVTYIRNIALQKVPDQEDFPYKAGDRVGQIFLEKVIEMDFIEVEELTSTTRGEGGFGSTGK